MKQRQNSTMLSCIMEKGVRIEKIAQAHICFYFLFMHMKGLAMCFSFVLNVRHKLTSRCTCIRCLLTLPIKYDGIAGFSKIDGIIKEIDLQHIS